MQKRNKRVKSKAELIERTDKFVGGDDEAQAIIDQLHAEEQDEREADEELRDAVFGHGNSGMSCDE